MASTSGPNLLSRPSARPTPFSVPRTQRPPVVPSIDKILSALPPTDADVFRLVLDGVPLVCRTPPAFRDLPPLSTNTDPNDASPARMWATPILKEPVSFFVVFTRMPGFFCGPGCTDDLRYAARVALRFTAAELDAQIEACVSSGRASSRTIFTPLLSYRLACIVALTPLNVNLAIPRPPPTIMAAYAWTWRTCTTCTRHVGHALGGTCEVLCEDALWFTELWRKLVAILRLRPDPDAVLVRGWEHLSKALRAPLACPTCAGVAYQHLRCFHGLLIVEIAKRVAEVSVFVSGGA
ncbi:hypothetical protein GSI_12671 [Ganoderma sinense ZZ0214-1]|uniref:Uncharacterized protein n=1 Tax=Ganoderma sinense ZZ0214-1 TaxID=1077348 RepID=A0A2G8RTD7_9APHY|nr:hypothetical protein GSI_12671 [Ganoderma sinense ZZ0214-1]